MERNKLRINATTLGELMNALETMRGQRVKELKKIHGLLNIITLKRTI